MNTPAPHIYLTGVLRNGLTRLDLSFSTPDVGVVAAVTTSGRPFLNLATSEAQVTITTTGGGPVAAAAVRYLGDCVRIHSEQEPGPTLPGLDDLPG
ncbi:hypothetical protein GCM10018953_08780 [Streptosporangium nondiastaticum]|uniref:hypothetical protein n=1 Tax=Streptosporangium nondiastaticum TaxID=35764 RepID=UPI0031F813F6